MSPVNFPDEWGIKKKQMKALKGIDPKKKLTLADVDDKINVEELKKKKPDIVIVATRCSGCGEAYPFVFSNETLYYAKTYLSWHQYLTCPNDGNEVSVYSGHGDFVYNPYKHKFK